MTEQTANKENSFLNQEMPAEKDYFICGWEKTDWTFLPIECDFGLTKNSQNSETAS